MSPTKCPSCRLSLPPNWGGLTDPKGRCPYCGKPLTSAKDMTPTPMPVAVRPPAAAGAKTILWGAGASHPERTPPVQIADLSTKTPGVVPTSKDKTPPPVHVSNPITPGMVPTSKDKTPPPVHVSNPITPGVVPTSKDKTPSPVHVSNPITPGVVPTSKDKTPPPVHVSNPITPGVVPTSKDKTPPPVHVSNPITPGVVPTSKDKTPSPVEVEAPQPPSPSLEEQPAPTIAVGTAPTILAPDVHLNPIFHKPIETEFPITEDVVFTPSVVVAPKAPGKTNAPDTAAPILAVLAASQELSLADVELASSEHGPKKGQGINPAEEITAIDPPIADSTKNVPEWVVAGNESYGVPQKRKIGLFAGLGVGLLAVAVIVFFLARGKETAPPVQQTALTIATPEKIPESVPTPKPAPILDQKPSPPPAPMAKAVPAEIPAAPLVKPVVAENPEAKAAPLIRPAVKATVTEKPTDKVVPEANVRPSAPKQPRAEKTAVIQRPEAEVTPFAKKAESPAPKTETSLAKNSEEKQQKAMEAYQRGNSKLFQGNLIEAIADFKLAIRLNPKEPAPYRGVGLAYAQQGKSADAVKNLKRYLSLAPKASDRALIEKRIQQLQ